MNIVLPTDLKEKYDYLIVHTFATPPSMTDVDAAWVDRMHRQRGWSGCGYHAVILRSGELQHESTGHRTRPYARTGAHVGGCGPGWNNRCLGISMAGGVKEDGRTPDDNYTDDQMETLWSYIEAACDAFAIEPDHVIGHRDLIKMTDAAPKACPCFSVKTWLSSYLSDDFRADFGNQTPDKRQDKVKVTKTYTVREEDTLWGISNAYGVPLWRLRKLNPTVEHDFIYPGQKLRLLK